MFFEIKEAGLENVLGVGILFGIVQAKRGDFPVFRKGLFNLSFSLLPINRPDEEIGEGVEVLLLLLQFLLPLQLGLRPGHVELFFIALGELLLAEVLLHLQGVLLVLEGNEGEEASGFLDFGRKDPGTGDLVVLLQSSDELLDFLLSPSVGEIFKI